MKVALQPIGSVGREGLPARGDVALAAALAALALADLWALELDELKAHRLAATPFAILVPLTLGWRRRRTAEAAGVAAAGVALQGLIVEPTTSLAQTATVLLLAFSLGAHETPRRALAGLAASMVAVVSIAIGASESAGAILSIPVFLAVPYLAGVAVRAARRYAERLERLTEQLERERERSSRLAVAEERARIARELHDVVSHGVGVMSVQAAGARRIVNSDPMRAREALSAIESTGRSALVDLERMLQLMRSPDVAVSTTDSTPRLADLPALAARLRAAGLDVELVCHGSAPPAPPALELAVYRVLQEGLTNAVKHAPGASVRAVIRFEPGAIELEVVDRGNVGAPPAAGGHGLVGMRERVSLFRGEFEAGPQPEGGFRVYARIPVPEASR